MLRFGCAAALGLALVFGGSPAWAQARGDGETFSIRGGLGFTADPDSFLLGVGVPFAISDHLAMGPTVEFGVSDDTTWVAPTWSGEFRLDLGDRNPLLPYVHAGVGLAYLEKDRRGRGDDDDVGLLLDAGLGADYWVDDTIALGSRLTFHYMPSDVEDENFIFSWQILTGRFSF